MPLNRRHANRFVYATVRLPEMISNTHAKACFEDQGWTFDDKESERTFILHIPLYCTQFTALAVAESKLRDFTEKQIPLVVEEVRVLSRTEISEKSAKLKKRGLTLPFHWKIAFAPHETDEGWTKNQWVHAVKKRGDDSQLPGDAYTPGTLVINSPTDRKLDKRLSQHPWIALLFFSFFLAGLGYLLYTNHPGEDIGQLGTPLFHAILLLLALIGWRHLLILYPEIRVLWSVASLSLFLAASTVLGQVLISAWESRFSIPPDVVNYPVWFRLATAGYATLIVALAVFLVFGILIGWPMYSGVIAMVPETIRVLVGAITALLILSAALNALQLVLAQSERVLSGWHDELIDDRTPSVAGDFIYRACLVPVDDQASETMADAAPLTVIEGKNDRYWSWDIGPTSSGIKSDTAFYNRSATELDTEDFKVMRLANDVTSCDALQSRL